MPLELLEWPQFRRRICKGQARVVESLDLPPLFSAQTNLNRLIRATFKTRIYNSVSIFSCTVFG